MKDIFNESEIPLSFVKIQQRADGCAFKHYQKPMYVIIDESLKDGELWRHVSVSKRDHKDRLVDVSWEEICDVKDKFIGDRYAYMVFPPKENYVNIAHVFHLWCRVHNDKVLPEFSRIINGIGRSI